MSNSQLEQTFAKFMAGIYGDNSQSEDFIAPGKSLSAQESLSVYRSSVKGNLIQALSDIYPAVKRCLGEVFFEAMAARYVDQHPSVSPGLDDYGEFFTEFMAEFQPLSELPYISDLGRLEWAWHRAFHAPDELEMNAKELSGLSEEQQLKLRFKVLQSLQLFKFDYPISKIWQMNRELIADQEIDLNQGGEFVVVWRKHYDTRVEAISLLDYLFLKEIKKGHDLGTIYQLLLSKTNSEQLIATFVRILSSGWLTAHK